MVIFDCNGVLVDSELLITTTASQEFSRIGLKLPPDLLARYFTGRRTADMLAEIETAAGRRLPDGFAARRSAAFIERLRRDLRPTAHIAHALSWLRGPKCVASSAPLERMRICLETAGLLKFFDPCLFSASDLQRGKPAPDIFLLVAEKMRAAPRDCIVVEDSPVGVTAAAAAGMTPIGFVGGSHAGPDLATRLKASGARAVIGDMRMLKGAVVDLRGW
jgi:beta-phosphoglucomutase-like phosphatase (HAD superfamily)